MKLAAALFASCSAVLAPYAVPGDGTKCFLSCQRDLFEVYLRCSIEWGTGNEDFDRCYAGAEEEMVRCYEEDCPADACSKTCGGPFKEDIVTCDTLYEENTIDTIGYVICLNKISLDMLNCAERCFCDQNEAAGICECTPITPPTGLETFAPKWSSCTPIQN